MNDALSEALLGVLGLLDAGETALVLPRMAEISAEYAGHPDVADLWSALGDSRAARGPWGVQVLQAMIPVAQSWPDARGRSTMWMAMAELEATHREASWAAHWLKKAIEADPTDARPWDLLELMLDLYPTLPVGRATKDALRELRKAQGLIPVKEEDFSGITFDEWDEDNESTSQ